MQQPQQEHNSCCSSNNNNSNSRNNNTAFCSPNQIIIMMIIIIIIILILILINPNQKPSLFLPAKIILGAVSLFHIPSVANLQHKRIKEKMCCSAYGDESKTFTRVEK